MFGDLDHAGRPAAAVPAPVGSWKESSHSSEGVRIGRDRILPLAAFEPISAALFQPAASIRWRPFVGSFPANTGRLRASRPGPAPRRTGRPSTPGKDDPGFSHFLHFYMAANKGVAGPDKGGYPGLGGRDHDRLGSAPFAFREGTGRVQLRPRQTLLFRPPRLELLPLPLALQGPRPAPRD